VVYADKRLIRIKCKYYHKSACSRFGAFQIKILGGSENNRKFAHFSFIFQIYLVLISRER